MKRNLKALLTASALALSLVVASPMAALAAEADETPVEPQSPITIEGFATPEDVDTVKDADGNEIENFGQGDIPVSAEIVGSADKIIYSVRVEYGDMNFSYDFGQTWDPETHTYSVKKTDEFSGGWVVRKCIDGKNNAIKVTNNSNYPIHTELSYTQDVKNGGTFFNSSLNQTNNVVGIFSKDNDTLAAHINDDDYNGLHATNVDAMMTTTFDLDMDYSNLTIGEYDDYGVLPNTNDNFQKFSQTIYFALCGTPDSTVTFTDGYVPVGTIKFTVSPVPKDQTVKRVDLP